MRRKRLATPKTAIAEYWLGTEEGRHRLPDNAAAIDRGEPMCFACGFNATDPDEPPVIWSVWKRARLDRCHLVPRSLGGEDRVENLVLLCTRCHLDAPDVADPTYMLSWIAERESWWSSRAELANRALAAAGADGDLNTWTAADHESFLSTLRTVLFTWTALHGSHISDATMEAAVVETIRRIQPSRSDVTGPSGA